MAIFSDSMFQANMGTQFESPYEGMYLNSPGWSMNSAYMSPSYMGNFRPDYGGHTGFSTNNLPPFSTTGAIGAASGMHQTPYYLNPIAYRSEALNQLATAPADASMWTMQNIAAPLAAFGMGTMISGMTMPSVFGASGAQRFTGGAAAQLGMAGRTANAYWQTYVTGQMTTTQLAKHNAARAGIASAAAGRQSLGAFSGSRVGSAFGRMAGMAGGGMGGALGGAAGRYLGLGGSISSGAVRGAMGLGGAGAAIGGAVGAAAGSVFLPFMLASGITEGMDEFLFDPYIAMRRGTQAASANLSGIYTGSSPMGTLGVSRGGAAAVGTALAQAGYEDRAFGSEGGVNIFDMSMKAGLMSEVGNLDPEQIKRQVKNISKQVQALMAVAGDPDVGRAIQSLAKMKKLGISGADANTTIQALGAAEAISGTSSLQIMNTIGTQSSYMFQQAGIGPQGAMQAAASSYAGFSNAYKMGLINPSTLAMMGGTEGATQSLIGGQIGLARSMYNQMTLANRFMYGNEQSGLVNNVGSFGQYVANNPLAAMGALRMNSGPMIGAQLQENPMAPARNIFDYLQNIPGVVGQNGRVRWDAFAGAGLSMGMSEDQMRALLEQMRMFQSPGAQERMRSASLAKMREQYASYLEREGLDFTTGSGVVAEAGRAFHGIGLWASDMKRGIATGFGNMSQAAGRYVDAGSRAMFGYLGADPADTGVMSEDAFVNMFTSGEAGDRQTYRFANPDTDNVLGRLANSETLDSMGYLGSLVKWGAETANNTLDEGSANRAMFRKVSIKLNEGTVSEAKYNEIMALPPFKRSEELKKTFGLSSREAATFAKIAPKDASLARGATHLDDIGLVNDIPGGKIGKVTRALMGARQMSKPSSRDTSRGFGTFSNVSTNLSGGTGTPDLDAIQGLQGYKDRLLALSLGNQLTKDPSSISAFLAETKGTSDGDDVRRVLSTLLGRSSVEPGDLADFEDREFAERRMSSITRLLGRDGNLRSFINTMDGDFSRLLKKGGVEDIAREAYSMRRVAASAGIGGVHTGSYEELSKLSDMERAAFENQKQFANMAETGKLDFTGYLEATNANKMSVAADKFSDAANMIYAAATGTEYQGRYLSQKADTP